MTNKLEIPNNIHIQKITDEYTNQETTIVWADRTYIKCETCGEEMDHDLTDRLFQLYSDTIVEPEQMHWCGELLKVQWIRCDYENDIPAAVERVMERVQADKEAALERTKKTLKADVEEAMNKLNDGEPAGYVATSCGMAPGVEIELIHDMWCVSAWCYNPDPDKSDEIVSISSYRFIGQVI